MSSSKKGKSTASSSKSKPRGSAVHGRGSGARQARKQAFEAELRQLEQDLEALDPRTATLPAKFADLPLSSATQAALKDAYFHTLTPVQAKSLPYTLKGHDILGAARTGSGKTLAFIVPLLEKLYRAKWGPNDGLGALVISPTRELAVQIFEVLRKVGNKHNFSAGLVIGGKSLKDEQDRLSRMNILIATPGRLLQHMDQTVNFDTSNLQMLVLDEADRILDLGFSKTLDAIVQNLPPSTVRQTLLFSATQSNSITSLARLSLRDPVYVSVRDSENASTSAITGQGAEDGADSLKALETPKGLEQHYMLVELDRKLDTLWSFIKSHLGCKILVFMSSCKQVRFTFETFRHLRPGISLLHMHGKQKQSKRLEIFTKFSQSDKCVLFATDIAARGLDFPAVTWVVQMDCPEDVDTYIHRVGRTARYNSKGKALLFLLPSEQDGFLKRLKDKSLYDKISLIKASAAKQQTIQKQFQSLAFQFPEIKFLAQRAFISYVRSVYLQKDKHTFKVDSLPLDKYAESLGLAGAPKIKFISKNEASAKKNKAREVEKLKAEAEAEKALLAKSSNVSDESEVDTETSSSEDEDEEEETASVNGRPTSPPKTVQSKTAKYDKMFKRKNQDILSDHFSKAVAQDDDAEGTGSLLGPDAEQEDFITLARPHHALTPNAGAAAVSSQDAGEPEVPYEDVSKRRLKQGVTKKGLLKLRGQGEKLVFDDDGEAHALYELVGEDQIQDVNAERRRFVEDEAAKMQKIDALDKEALRQLKKDKKLQRKEREREVKRARRGESGAQADLAVDSSDEENRIKEIDFDLPDEASDEEEVAAVNTGKMSKRKYERAPNVDEGEDDLEAMALRAIKKHRI